MLTGQLYTHSYLKFILVAGVTDPAAVPVRRAGVGRGPPEERGRALLLLRRERGLVQVGPANYRLIHFLKRRLKMEMNIFLNI